MLLKDFWKNNLFEQKTTGRKCFFWNMMGCGMNAATSMLLLLIVTRVLGEVEGGIFSIGFALACQIWTFANFETTTFHVTNKDNQYTNNHFFQQKSILCVLAILTSVIIVLIKGYDFHKMAVVLWLCVFKILDAFSSFYTGLCQKEGRLDVGGYSYFWRILISLVAFGICLLLKFSLTAAIVVMCCVSFVWILLVEVRIGAYAIDYTARWDISKIWNLTMSCFGVFLASFMLMYVINMPKYTIDRLMDEAAQTYFNIIFLPVSVINLLGLFIFRPALTTMSDMWNGQDYKQLTKMCRKIMFLILGMTVAILLAGYLCGIPVLQIVFGVQLAQYKTALMLTLLGGGFYAAVTFLYYVMVVMRKHQYIIVAYVVALIGQMICADYFVTKYGIMGASLMYLVAMLFVVFVAILEVNIIMLKSRKETERV